MDTRRSPAVAPMQVSPGGTRTNRTKPERSPRDGNNNSSGDTSSPEFTTGKRIKQVHTGTTSFYTMTDINKMKTLCMLMGLNDENPKARQKMNRLLMQKGDDYDNLDMKRMYLDDVISVFLKHMPSNITYEFLNQCFDAVRFYIDFAERSVTAEAATKKDYHLVYVNMVIMHMVEQFSHPVVLTSSSDNSSSSGDSSGGETVKVLDRHLLKSFYKYKGEKEMKDHSEEEIEEFGRTIEAIFYYKEYKKMTSKDSNSNNSNNNNNAFQKPVSDPPMFPITDDRIDILRRLGLRACILLACYFNVFPFLYDLNVGTGYALLIYDIVRKMTRILARKKIYFDSPFQIKFEEFENAASNNNYSVGSKLRRKVPREFLKDREYLWNMHKNETLDDLKVPIVEWKPLENKWKNAKDTLSQKLVLVDLYQKGIPVPPAIPQELCPVFSKYTFAKVLGEGSYGMTFAVGVGYNHTFSDGIEQYALKMQRCSTSEEFVLSANAYKELKIWFIIDRSIRKINGEMLYHLLPLNIVRLYDWVKCEVNPKEVFSKLHLPESDYEKFILRKGNPGSSDIRKGHFQFMIGELCDGGVDSIVKTDLNKLYNIPTLRSFLIQVLKTDDDLQELFDFTHYDTTLRNVLYKVMPMTAPYKYLYYSLNNVTKDFFFINLDEAKNIIFKLNDFGLSTIAYTLESSDAPSSASKNNNNNNNNNKKNKKLADGEVRNVIESDMSLAPSREGMIPDVKHRTIDTHILGCSLLFCLISYGHIPWLKAHMHTDGKLIFNTLFLMINANWDNEENKKQYDVLQEQNVRYHEATTDADIDRMGMAIMLNALSDLMYQWYPDYILSGSRPKQVLKLALFHEINSKRPADATPENTVIMNLNRDPSKGFVDPFPNQ